MIKTQTSDVVKEKKPIKFPLLMRGSRGLIVLFTAPGCGTLLVTGGDSYSKHDIGLHRNQPNILWDMSRFKPYDGAVTLSNEQA